MVLVFNQDQRPSSGSYSGGVMSTHPTNYQSRARHVCRRSDRYAQPDGPWLGLVTVRATLFNQEFGQLNSRRCR